MAEFDFRVVLGDFLDDRAPQLTGRQHIRLVHRAELLVAHHGHVEADLGDAADLALAVRQRVVRHALTVLQYLALARLSEVDTAGQLAHDQDIQPGNDFRLERRGIGQLRIEQRRAQIAEQPQLGADLQQAALGTNGRIDGVPLRSADGAQQDGVSGTSTLQGLIGQRHAVLVDSRTTELVVAQLEAQLKLVIGQLQHLDRLGHDFRANTIARENQNLFGHFSFL